MTRRARRNHSASFKAKVAVAATKGEQTMIELAQEFDVPPNQMKQWRDQVPEVATGVAEAIGKTSEAISNIERARSLPGLDTLIAIAGALKSPLHDFFPDEALDDIRSPNRIRLDAEAAAILRSLSDESAKVAIGQLKAMATIPDRKCRSLSAVWASQGHRVDAMLAPTTGRRPAAAAISRTIWASVTFS